MKKYILIFVMMAAGLSPAFAVSNSPNLSDEEAKAIVVKDLQDRTKLSGTLDIYDKELKTVRHLKMTDGPISINSEDDNVRAAFPFRDLKSGEMISVFVPLVYENTKWTVGGYTIGEVKVFTQTEAAKKTFSDEEVQQFAKTYLDQQAKFTGSTSLYDEENKKLRSLELVSLQPAVKRFGSVVIVRGDFKDIESNDTLVIDVNIGNKEGALSVQNLLIRDVKKQ